MNDIFKDMQAKVGCDYISDLPSYKRKVWHEMKRLNPADYEERQLEDFSKYVFGMPYQTLVKLHFMKSNNLSDELQVEANSRSLIIDAKTLRLYFGIEYSNNMGDILCQFTKQLGEIIPNNSTMSHIVGKIIKRYGNTEEAYLIFLKKAELCNPPLPESELKVIWRSVSKFGNKVSNQEGYILPEQYNSDCRLKPEDFSDVGQATVLAMEYKDILNFLIEAIQPKVVRRYR